MRSHALHIYYYLDLRQRAGPGGKLMGTAAGENPKTPRSSMHTQHTFRQPFRQYQTLNTDSPPARHWPTHPMPQAWGCAVPFCQGRPPASESTGFLIGMEAKYWRNSGTTATYVVGAGVPLTLNPSNARPHQPRTHARPLSNRI